MATTITAADLTVTVTEAVTLNGQNQGGSHTLTVSSVTQTARNIVNIGTSVADIIGFGSVNAQGSFIRTSVKYIRITNLDDTNFIVLGFSKTGADTFFVKLEPGKTWMAGNDDLQIDASGGAFSAFVEADNVSAMADTAACDLEYFVALV
jgi:hypothetical protein